MAVCIDVKALGPLSHMVHSLSWDSINRKVSRSTLDGNVFNVCKNDKKMYVDK